MSDKQRHIDMDPMSGEPVEVDGVYKDEWGHEEKLERGDVFPAAEQLGTSEWELVEFDLENHTEGRTDPRLVPKKKITAKEAHLQHPRRHKKKDDDQ